MKKLVLAALLACSSMQLIAMESLESAASAAKKNTLENPNALNPLDALWDELWKDAPPMQPWVPESAEEKRARFKKETERLQNSVSPACEEEASGEEDPLIGRYGEKKSLLTWIAVIQENPQHPFGETEVFRYLKREERVFHEIECILPTQRDYSEKIGTILSLSQLNDHSDAKKLCMTEIAKGNYLYIPAYITVGHSVLYEEDKNSGKYKEVSGGSTKYNAILIGTRNKNVVGKHYYQEQ